MGTKQSSKEMGVARNELAASSSSYLISHADNPVLWREWTPKALAEAEKAGKPLLVSIGYSACHWCHVMARESFVDEGIASVMNDHFVCIKIDREERPDLDQIYMDACQQMTGRGGWPLNAFAFPDGRPFYAVTYLPPESWRRLLDQIVALFRDERDALSHQAGYLSKRISDAYLDSGIQDAETTASDTESLIRHWSGFVDHHHAGFGSVQKFPLPVAHEALMALHRLSASPEVLKWVTHALDRMMTGCLMDPIGGGFFRYCVDREWRVPHFEKMLYDNVQLAALYAHAWQLCGHDAYAVVFSDTISFLERDMRSTLGGFISSLNAESEGEEGAYYTWSFQEISTLLDEPLRDLIARCYHITPAGNWQANRSIPRAAPALDAFASAGGQDPFVMSSELEHGRQKLFAARLQRPPPGRDEKILLCWNALMVSTYVTAARATGQEKYRDKAVELAAFLNTSMSNPHGGLWRCLYPEGPRIPGFLDDYALFIRALIDLYGLTFDQAWLDRAHQLCAWVIGNFSTISGPFFFYSSTEHSDLPARTVDLDDQVLPSSNSVMAECLLDLSCLLDRSDFRDRAMEMVGRVHERIVRNGPYAANWARVWAKIKAKRETRVMVGRDARNLALSHQGGYRPFTLFAGGEEEAGPLLQGRKVAGKTVLYECRDGICDAPRVIAVQEGAFDSDSLIKS